MITLRMQSVLGCVMQTVDQAGKRGVSAQLLQQIQDLLPRNGIKSLTKYQGRRTEPPLPISSAGLRRGTDSSYFPQVCPLPGRFANWGSGALCGMVSGSRSSLAVPASPLASGLSMMNDRSWLVRWLAWLWYQA